MGFLSRVLERRASPENPSTNLANPAAWLIDWVDGRPTRAGVRINEQTALRISAVFGCIRAIAESVASLPLFVYERLPDGGKRPAPNHPVFGLVHDAPSELMTSFVWRETLQGHACGWGNGYSEIVVKGNRPVELLPLLPDRTEPRMSGKRLFYVVNDREAPSKEPRVLAADEVIHVPGLGFDGLKGYSPIALHRENLGLAMAAVEFGAALFGSGSRPAGVLEHPARLGDEAARQVAESWQRLHGGVENAHKIAVLEEGMKWRQMTIPPEDAQFVETRELEVAEICRIFRVPPHKVQHLKQATFSNIEMQAIEWVTDTILPWLVRWEQELNRKLLTRADRERYFIEHKVDGLLRGDIKSRYDAYAVGRQWGWLSANEVRGLENLNPIGEAGDVYMAPMNMVPAEQLGQPLEPVRDDAAGERAERRGELRAVRLRQRLQNAQSRVLFRAATDLVRAEVAEIRRDGLPRLAQRSVSDFKQWVEEFFDSTQARTQRTMAPALLAFAEQMAAVAADEINADPPDLRRFVAEYVQSFAVRHAGSQLGQLLELIDTTDVAELAGVIEARLGEWVEKSPQKIARNESTRAGAAFAKAVWVVAGLTVLRWVTLGDTCPLCRSFDGRVVSIRGYFARPGDTVDPGGASPLNVEKNIGHPPLHRGCDCMIAPG